MVCFKVLFAASSCVSTLLFSIDTRSTRREASRTDADVPRVEDEAEAEGAAETGGQQQPSLGETASSSQDLPVSLLETIRARITDGFALARDGLARTQPTALPKFDVPTFTGEAAGSPVIDFPDDLSV
ncbi:hypothetical protein MTO96_052353 [Rhipicephalus appendiculatus]